jgi:hypothetical protein
MAELLMEDDAVAAVMVHDDGSRRKHAKGGREAQFAAPVVPGPVVGYKE